MNQNNKKKKSENTPNKKTISNSLSRYEKSNLIVYGIGHILTLILVFVAIEKFINVKKQYEVNIDQFEKSIEQYNSNCEQQKKANTIAYLQSLHELVNNTDESLLEIIKYYDIDNDSISMISCDSLEKIIKENHPYRKQLNDLYIGFNQFAIGCWEGFFDEKIAWSANASMISRVTKALIPYYELIEKENNLVIYGSFLRIMVFRWKHANPFKEEHHKWINQLIEETGRATNDSMPIIRRMPEVNE